MNELKVFENERFGQVRMYQKDGDPWFVAKDVAEALGYTWNGTQRIEHVPQEWRGVTSVVTPSGTQEMACLSEQGLYFFLARSDKPAALPFQKWIAGEVIPAIRKHGLYAEQELLDNPDLLIKVATRLKEERAARLEAEKQLTLAAPKVAFFDQVASSKDAIPMRDAASVLNIPGMGRNNLFRFLRDNKVLMEDNIPYREYQDRGYFRVIEQQWSDSEGETHISLKTLVYQKGLDYIRSLVMGQQRTAA